jgi:hypothetical protein
VRPDVDWRAQHAQERKHDVGRQAAEPLGIVLAGKHPHDEVRDLLFVDGLRHEAPRQPIDGFGEEPSIPRDADARQELERVELDQQNLDDAR